MNSISSVLALVAICLSPAALAQDLAEPPDPAGAGFSPARLARIAPWYQSQVDAGAFTGAVVAVARQGKLAYLQAIGTQDWAKKSPMTPQSIFWIASMTKPVTSVAAMMLVEEGKLDLDAPLENYLPEFKDKQVAREEIEPRTGKRSLVLEPAKRAVQVIDLLRHTAGLTYPEEGATIVHRMYALANFRRDRTLADFVASLDWLPLIHQPGEVWEYSWGVDVLARLIEVVSGQPFDAFVEGRIFKPLGMVDTGFSVPDDKLARLVDPPPGGRPSTWDVTKPARLFSGGGGLVSTAPDYLRFCQMLLNGGELDGNRILSAQTIKRMTTPSLPADMRFAGNTGQFVGPGVGSSWGLGFAIRTNPEFSQVPGAVGSFSWGGLWGTYFWIDPVEKLAAIQMLQILPEANNGQSNRALRHLTYAALSVPQPNTNASPSSAAVTEFASYAGKYDFGMSLSSRDKQAPLPGLSGVGLELAKRGDQVVVQKVIDGTPAERAGLSAGDVITDIDDKPIKDLAIALVVQRMRGMSGTEVRLRVTRKEDGKPIDVVLRRQSTRLPGAEIQVRADTGELTAEAVGSWSVLDFEKGKRQPLKTVSNREFCVESGDHTRLAFLTDSSGKVTGAVLNPGPWQIEGAKLE